MSASHSYSNDVKSLHLAIEEGDIDEVKRLLSKLPFDKNFFDVNNISAAAVAIKWEKHEIYEYFVAEGIFLGPHEWMDEATYGQKRSRKENLRDIHRKYFNDPNLKHLINLITSTKLSHEASASDRREHLRLITEAFEDLNGLKSIEPILKVASTSPKLRIVFDFNRDSVEFLDPVKNRNVMGTSYTENCILYVGAKDLKEENKRCEVLGVLIHELTHFVMKLLYDNEAKPYQRGNQEKQNEFSQVVEETAAKKESEPYIEAVYVYPVSEHHAELIVRVPHLAALYKDDEDKTMEVQMEFSELFDFYEENTLVDLKREFPLMKVKHEIRELNGLCGILAILEASDVEMSSQAMNGLDLSSLSNDKILFISSNCPQLTLSAIYQQVRVEIHFETSFIFVGLRSLQNAKIFDLAMKAFALSTHPSMIIHCQGDVKFDAVMRIVERLNERKINQKVIFIFKKKFEASSDANFFEVRHSWNHLTNTFQQKLLENKVEFHGTKMTFKELVNDLSSIESIPFQDLLDDETIVIGKDLNLNSSEKLIERKFLPSNSVTVYKGAEDYTIEHDLDELLTVIGEQQTILISDEPGTGKSTSLKMMQSKLRQRNPSLWLVFMYLKDNFEAYQVSRLEVHKREDIAKFLSKKVLKVEGFEAEVFTQLFNEDRVVLLMDGLDEICPSYKQFIFSLMNDIQKHSKNRLWISTRPHLVEEMKKKLNPIEFSLKPFTEANRREFFEKHFIEDQNSELKLKEIESFLEKLRPYFGQTNDVCNPLVMRMIAEILDEDENLKLSEANLFVIYDRFTIKMIEKCHDKGLEAKRDLAKSFGNSNVIEFYEQEAFLTCFTFRSFALMREKLIDPQFEHVCRPPLDEIVRVGLMFESSSGNLHFIHQTFAEFYVAKFFYEAIFKFRNLRSEKYLNATLEFLLKNVLEKYEYNFIRILLDNAVDSDKRLSVKNFPLSTLQFLQEKMELRHLMLLVRSSCFNLIKFIVVHLYPGGQKLLFSKDLNNRNFVMIAVEYQPVDFIKRFFALLNDLNADEFKKMFFEREKDNRNVFFFAASNPSSEAFKFMVEFCESITTSDELNELLMQKGKPDKTLLHNAVKNGRNVDFIIEVLTQKLSSFQQKSLLEELTDDYKYNLLQYAAERKNSFANFEHLLAFMRKVMNSEDIENFLLHEDRNGFKAFDFALTNKNEIVFDVIRKFYLEVFGENKMREIIFSRRNCENWLEESSLYFQRICSRYKAYYDGAFKRFLSFVMQLFAVDSIRKEFFLTKDEDGETFLKFAVMELGEEDFAALCSLLKTNDRMEILQQINSRGECAFHSAAKRNNLEIFHKVRKMYEESFDDQNFRKLIVSCNKSWVLDVIEMYNYQNSKTFTELCHYLIKLFKGKEETETLKAFFLFTDRAGQTAFMAAARSKKSKEFEHLYTLTKELYAVEAVKEFLLIEDANGATAFTHSFMKSLDTTFEFVRNVFEELFEPEKMREIVLVKVRCWNILSLSIHLSSRLGSFEIVCNYVIKLFENEAQKLKNTFLSVDSLDETALMKAALNSDENYFKVLTNVIEKLFVKEDIVEMLCQKSQDGQTAFHFSIGNKEEEIFRTVRDFYIKTLGNEAMRNIISAEVDWTNVLHIVTFGIDIKRLVPLIKSLFAEGGVHLKNIFLRPYEGRSVKEAIKGIWKKHSSGINASIISYLEEQFQDDEHIKAFVEELQSIVS